MDHSDDYWGAKRVTYKEFGNGKHYHISEGARLLTPRLHLGRAKAGNRARLLRLRTLRQKGGVYTT